MEEYLANLQQRDRIEQANRSTIDNYTLLAEKFIQTRNNSAQAISPEAAPATKAGKRVSSPAAPTTSNPDAIATIRTDLLAAQLARAQLETKLAIFTKLQDENKAQALLIEAQEREITELRQKRKDLKSENVGLRDLNRKVQDQIVSLEMEISQTEVNVNKLEKDNKELEDRWMKKMGDEADKMNLFSNWK